MATRWFAATEVLMAAILLAGCSGPLPGTGGGGEALPLLGERTWTLRPGQFAEANLAMDRNDRIVFALGATGGEVAWDVHGHAWDGAVETYMSGTDASVKEGFVAPEDHGYSILVEPRGDRDVVVKLRIEGSATVESWFPA